MSFPAHTQHQGGTSPRPGDVIAGKYRVERTIGAGGMGLVVAATHVHLGDRVAVKLLLPHAVGDTGHDQLVARFLREAQLAVRIKSQHVVRVFDVGTREGGDPYMVMELLDGQDLNAMTRRRGPLPVDEATEYVLQACEAVAEAHELGIVHRDLKPANLFVTTGPDGWPLVKVLDFGISKLLGGARNATDASLTSDADVLGSPLYMAPEQIRSPKGVDARCDIWSLGAILYKLLTGRGAFDADNPATVLALVLSDAPAPLREQRPEIPEALEELVLRCLEKDPQRRVQTVAELASGLLRFAPSRARGRLWEQVDGTASGAVVAKKDEQVTSRSRPTWSPARPRRRARTAAGVVAAVVVGGALVTLLAWSRAVPAPVPRAAAPTPPAAEPQPTGSPALADTAAVAAPAPASATASVEARAPQPPLASSGKPATSGAPSPSAHKRRPKEGKPVDPLEDRN